VKKYKTDMDKYGTVEQGFNVICTTYRLTEHYHYWTKNNPMNVQLVPEPFVEVPAELADRMGIRGGENVRVTSARSHYIAKAMVTRRIRPMKIDGKEMFQIGIPIHWGFRGIAEDARLIFTMDFLSWTICLFLLQTSFTSSAESQKAIQSFADRFPANGFL
jgi:formate dehydrogenase major subunit